MLFLLQPILDQSPKKELFLESEPSDTEGSIEISSPHPFIVPKQGKEQMLMWSAKIQEKEGIARVNSSSSKSTLASRISKPNPVQVAVSQPMVHDNENEIIDEFAELDAWLQSGAVEIV
jgi:hypothetical protein